MKKPKFADFFSGIGLAEIGLQSAGWWCVFANDIDPKKHQMWKSRYKRGHYVNRSIHEIDEKHIPQATLWWASFPCTDVSLAGYRAGLAGTQSGALMGLFRLLREKDGQRPPLVVLENVNGFISSHGGDDFDETVRQLNGIGYTCDAFVLDALHFVPQSRPRLFIVGVYDQPAVPKPGDALFFRHESLKSRQLTKFMSEDRDLNWCVLDIPEPPSPVPQLTTCIEELEPDSPYWWDHERVEYLLQQMSKRHAQLIETLKGNREISYATAYRRMRHHKSRAEVRADNIAGCLRTPRGGSSRQILIAAGAGTVRARFMTPRECARLMGAPDYPIDVPDNQAYFGFGDAVCVPAVKWIAENVLNPLISSDSKIENARVTA